MARWFAYGLAALCLSVVCIQVFLGSASRKYPNLSANDASSLVRTAKKQGWDVDTYLRLQSIQAAVDSDRAHELSADDWNFLKTRFVDKEDGLRHNAVSLLLHADAPKDRGRVLAVARSIALTDKVEPIRVSAMLVLRRKSSPDWQAIAKASLDSPESTSYLKEFSGKLLDGTIK